jgi:tRNA (mo5U34)-methyltransferase
MPELGIIAGFAMNRDPSAPPRVEVNWQPLLDAIPAWRDPALGLAATLDGRFAPGAHGDLARWQQALQALPDLAVDAATFGPTVTIAGRSSCADRQALNAALQALHPWRKGPFNLFGIQIDTEWRSDCKWQRVLPHLPSLCGQRILDVGCGNGYFGWRMLEAGAALVVGVDPTLLYCMQHRAVNRYVASLRNWVLPLRFEEMPAATFDTVFSMGVIYHRRDPMEHVERLYRHAVPGGTLVLESLVVTDGADLPRPGRYARMRNVWTVPTVSTLTGWLAAAGCVDVRVAEVTPTTSAEQRSTAWMRFESLDEALDPTDPARTVEGHPAPVRAIVLGRKPL